MLSIRLLLALASLCLATLPPAAPAWAGEGTCGNGVVEPGEQCDDGALLDLDGCTHSCLYEAVQRVESLVLEGDDAPDFCEPTTNRLGNAFSTLGLAVFNLTLAEAAGDPEQSILLYLVDLEEPTGSDEGFLEVGLLGAVPDPADPFPAAMDSWYRVGTDQLDEEGLPLERLGNGQILAFVLAAGPSDVQVPLLGSSLAIRGARLEAMVDTLSSLPAPPPYQPAPDLAAFETLDASGSTLGLCGNLTVGSLAAIPVPQSVTVGGNACRDDCPGSRSYVSCSGGPVTPSCHSLLDVLVGGCRVQTGCLLTVVSPTQPDVGVGANPPNTLSFAPSGGGIDKVVVVEPDDAYSSWFTLATQRVHITDNLGAVFLDGFESGSTAAWSLTFP